MHLIHGLDGRTYNVQTKFKSICAPTFLCAFDVLCHMKLIRKYTSCMCVVTQCPSLWRTYIHSVQRLQHNYPPPDEVAAFLRDQEFYWSVKGVASEQELVDELTTINPPAPPISLDDDCGGGGGNVSVGCFVGGAGVLYQCLRMLHR